MLHILVGVFFILHGLIHLIGFVVNWQIITTDEFPYATTLLAGRIDVGDGGIRVVGLLWLLAAVGFVIAGYGLITLAPWWLALTAGVTLFSSVMCILGWPQAQFGLYINLLILVLLFLDGRFHWIPRT
ncbi:MAG: ABC transporter permease [Chloroflexi bacterium]|nr:ABC transporter permease [Chloroflexota bacterium]